MTHDLRLERLVDGTPDEVYAAFTDPDAMTEWYEDHPGWVVEVISCDVRVGGSTIVAFGPDSARYREDMTYTAVDPGRRLAYNETFVMPDGASFDTALVITFDAQDGKTLLTIVQTGFESEKDRNDHQGGWPGFIDRIELVVAKRRSS